MDSISKIFTPVNRSQKHWPWDFQNAPSSRRCDPWEKCGAAKHLAQQ